MRYRETLSHSSGSIVISESEGLISAIDGFSRHPEGHSLFREFKAPLRFYGAARDWAKNIETTYGPDSVIGYLLERAEDNFVFQDDFVGEVGVQTFIEGLEFNHYLEFNPVQVGMVRKFVNRFETKVDIQSPTNLDGDAVTVYTPENLLASPQATRQSYYGYLKRRLLSSPQVVSLSQPYLTVDVDVVELDEISQTFQLGVGTSADLSPWKFAAEYDGNYQLDLKFHLAFFTGPYSDLMSTWLECVYQINDDTPVAFAYTETAVSGESHIIFTNTDLLTLSAKDIVRIYVHALANPPHIGTLSLEGKFFEPVDFTYISVIADTTFAETEVPAVLQHDVAASICDRITDPDKFYSEILGGTLTQARAYPDNGAWWNNVLLKGIHLRGYSLTEKPFSLSFKDFWDGAKVAFNLGFSYETIDGVERIVIRKRSEYYDTSQVAFEFLGVQRIKRRYGTEHFNATKFGFAKGKTDDISGIDDTQIRNDATILQNIGRLITNLTTWIFQGLTIEQARRTVKTKSADYKFDDDVVCIEVSVDGSDYKPRLNEDFVSVANLLNEASRYNKHHTPARFEIRWGSYLSGGLQNYLGSFFRFTGGEGNSDMISTMVSGSALDDYAGDPLSESENIPVSSTYDYIPILYDIEHYCTEAEFDQINLLRRFGGKISQTQTGSQFFFIEDFSRDKASGQLKMSGYFKEPFNIQSVAGGIIVQGGRVFDGSFDFSFE